MMQTANIISNLKDAGCSDMLIEHAANRHAKRAAAFVERTQELSS